MSKKQPDLVDDLIAKRTARNPEFPALVQRAARRLRKPDPAATLGTLLALLEEYRRRREGLTRQGLDAWALRQLRELAADPTATWLRWQADVRGHRVALPLATDLHDAWERAVQTLPAKLPDHVDAKTVRAARRRERAKYIRLGRPRKIRAA